MDKITLRHARLIRLATAFDDQSGAEDITFTLPEDLSEVEDEALSTLLDEAVEAFDALYEDRENLSSADVEAMGALADAVDTIRAENERRDAERAETRETADATAADVTADGDGEDEGEDAPAEAEQREAVAASSRPTSVTVRNVRRRPRVEPEDEARAAGRVLTAAAGLPGFENGQAISLDDAAEAVVRRSQGISEAAYRAAHQNGRHMRQSFSIASIRKEFDPSLVAGADNGQEVLTRAANERRLPGGSLVAAGGWCAPSETIYDLFEMESAEGLYSLPEVGVSRGGVRFTPGPDFSSIFAATGFTFTEEQDEDGLYDDGEEGPKPFYKIECPDFTEERLDVTGLWLTAGILQNRAYPEVIARTIRGALVGHQHRMAAQVLGKVRDGSTAVAMPADQVGALAPVLTAVEVQAEDYRNRHRMARSTTLEAVFPYWMRGAIRSDLSRRLGVPLENVTNSVIGQHLAERGIAPQFIYNYQDLTQDTAGDPVSAAQRTAWPEEVEFLLYAAGTFVRGSSDLITLENVYDSTLFSVNDFSSIFTEEGWLVAKMGHDARRVTVPICPNGATHGGVLIDCDGSAGDEGGAE